VEVREVSSAELLAQLRSAHAEVIHRIAEMERLTGEPVPNIVEFTAARFHVSRASLGRRALCQDAQRHLKTRVSGGDAEQLHLLMSIDSELRSHSARHISRWTVAAIELDWLGYCEDSRQMLRRMTVCIEAEQRMRYPLLARYR
jgi:hypothetical protein